MEATYTETQQRIRWASGSIGAFLAISMGLAIIVGINKGATLVVPFAGMVLVIGVYFLWAGISGYIASDSTDGVSGDGSGGILAVGLIFSLLIPVIGLIVGIGLLFRKTSYGALLMVTSIVGGIVWALILIAL